MNTAPHPPGSPTCWAVTPRLCQTLHRRRWQSSTQAVRQQHSALEQMLEAAWPSCVLGEPKQPWGLRCSSGISLSLFFRGIPSWWSSGYILTTQFKRKQHQHNHTGYSHSQQWQTIFYSCSLLYEDGCPLKECVNTKCQTFHADIFILVSAPKAPPFFWFLWPRLTSFWGWRSQ